MAVKKKYFIIFSILFLIFMPFKDNIFIESKKYYEKLPFIKKSYELNIDEPIGGIGKNKKIIEEYELNSTKNLRGISLLFATYGRKNEGNLEIKIFDKRTKQLLLEENLNQSIIEDNKYKELLFPEIKNGIKEVIIEISSDSEENNSVTIWKSKIAGNKKNILKINNIATEGSLLIKELYKPPFFNKSIFLGISIITVFILSFVIQELFSNFVYLIKIIKNYKIFFLDLKKYYNLLFEMVARDIKVKYKKSILGLMWSILNPLLMMIVMTIVFSTLFKSDIKNFPIYLLAGQITFSFFSVASNMAMMSIITNGSLLKKVYIPKYIFPTSKVIFALVNFLFSLIAVGIVAIFTKLTISVHIIALPVLILYVFLFSLGIGLILSSYAVFFRDLVHLYGIFLLIWTYFTPIFYPIRIIPPNFLIFIRLNPMYHYITYFREILLYNRWPTLRMNVVCIIFSMVFLTAGAIVFYKKQNELVLNV